MKGEVNCYMGKWKEAFVEKDCTFIEEDDDLTDATEYIIKDNEVIGAFYFSTRGAYQGEAYLINENKMFYCNSWSTLEWRELKEGCADNIPKECVRGVLKRKKKGG